MKNPLSKYRGLKADEIYKRATSPGGQEWPGSDGRPEMYRSQDLYRDRAQVVEVRDAAWATMDRLQETASKAGRALTQAQRADWDKAETECREASRAIEELSSAIQRMENTARSEAEAELGRGSGRYEEGKALTRSQTFGGYLQTRGLVRDSDDSDDRLDLGKYLRGLATGDWVNAEAERRAMSEGVLSGGGYAVPVQLLGQVIDLARAKTRVFEAGAQLVPMETQTTKVAKWASDPTSAWHSENAAITPSDASLGSVELKAKALASLTVASRELLEDASNIETELRNAFAAQFALTLDQAALYGTGTDPEPRGVKNTAGVTTAALDANGRTPTWDDLIDAAGVLEDRDETATGFIYAPRTARALGKAKTTDGQYVAPPTLLDGIARLASTQVPVDLTQGTSNAASDIFTGDWRHLFIGIRTRLQIEVLTERYADTGQIGFLAWFRGDVAVARAGSFHIQTGALA